MKRNLCGVRASQNWTDRQKHQGINEKQRSDANRSSARDGTLSSIERGGGGLSAQVLVLPSDPGYSHT